MFKNIVGHPQALKLLASDLNAGRIAPGYLFAGPEGVGKRAASLEFIRALNCEGPVTGSLLGEEGAEEPCEECAACRKLAAGQHPDVFFLDFESQSALLELTEDQEVKQKELKIGAVRILIQRAVVTPLELKKKVFVIDEAEHLSPEAANALLKVLEEPPAWCHWILISANAERLLPTLRSRCRRIPFGTLSAEEVRRVLEREKAEVSDSSALESALRLSGGSVSLARRTLNPKEGEWLRQALEAAEGTEEFRKNPLEWSASVFESGKRLGARKQAEEFLKVLAGAVSARLREAPDDQRADHLGAVLESLEELRRNVSPQMVLDALLARMALEGDPK